MEHNNRTRPQVPGDSSGCASGDGHRPSTGARGAKNPRERLPTRQTTTAHVIKDTDLLNIMAYNVQTLMDDGRLIELENSLKDICWDIIGLSEVRRLGEEVEERDDNIFFHFGETKGLYGVGFLVAKRWKDNIVEFIGYSERIAVLKFSLTPTKTLTVIQAYAPSGSHPDDEVEDFYTILNKACDENRSTWNICIGDFNAKIGKRVDTDRTNTIGAYGLGTRNDRGARLIQFAFGQSLQIANTYFFKKPQRRWTWKGPNGITKNEIDYIISSDIQIVKDVSCLGRIKFSSDHRPVRAKIRFDFKIHRKKMFTKQTKIHSKLTLLQNSDQFNLELSNSFQILNMREIEDVDEQFNTIVSRIKNSSKKIKTAKKQKAKLSEKSKKLIENRQICEVGTEEYRKIDKLVKRSIRYDIRKLNCDLVKAAIERNTSLRIAKQGISKGRRWINSLQDASGIKHNSRNKVMEICTHFYETLYTDNEKGNLNLQYSRSDSIPFITGKEVHDALKTMKYGKSPGEDGITTEELKIGSETLIPPLTNLFNSILDTGHIPQNMCHSNIVLLHKKGDTSNINNYRPISLISHIYNFFIKIIQNRIAGTLDRHQPPEQAGFRPHFSTTDHLHTLNQIIEKHIEHKKPIYLAFVDYAKAFDSLKHSAIFSALHNQGIEATYINLLKIIYDHSTADIKLHSSGPSFKISKGVKQGDPLSPKLFTSTLEEVFKTLAASWATKGIDIGGKLLTNLRFADDIVLFAPSALELELMLQDLSRASLEVGLLMNWSKTQLMTNSTKHRVMVDGQTIHYVEEYTYLGQIVSFDNRHDREISRRIDNAWKSYWSMKALMKGDLPISLKRQLIDMCILPILTYGAQTWSLTKIQRSRLMVCQRAMERSILGIKRQDRVRNTMLRSMTGVTDVGNKAARLKWEWAGHVSRMHPDRWAKVSTDWVPLHSRPRGRPPTRWRDELGKFKKDWTALAQDRDSWKKLGETFAQQWDNTG